MDKIEQQIEKIAIAVAKGFDERREYLDKRFDEHQAFTERRLDRQEAYMDGRFGEVDERLNEINLQLRDIRDALRKLHEVSISLDEQDELRRRLVRVEDHLGLPHELPQKPVM